MAVLFLSCIVDHKKRMRPQPSRDYYNPINEFKVFPIYNIQVVSKQFWEDPLCDNVFPLLLEVSHSLTLHLTSLHFCHASYPMSFPGHVQFLCG